MLTANDLAFVEDALAEIIGDRPLTITFRRVAEEIGPYTVRLSRKGAMPTQQTSAFAEQTVARWVMLSVETLPIQRGDRFNAYGHLFQVENISPQQVGFHADVFMVQ